MNFISFQVSLADQTILKTRDVVKSWRIKYDVIFYLKGGNIWNSMTYIFCTVIGRGLISLRGIVIITRYALIIKMLLPQLRLNRTETFPELVVQNVLYPLYFFHLLSCSEVSFLPKLRCLINQVPRQWSRCREGFE